MKKNEREESLGTRLKGYEREFERRIEPTDFIVVRIDGHKFSKYTKGMRKPFDEILSTTMVKTTEALVEEFGAVTGYTQSDEITLIFPPMYKETLRPIDWKDIEISEVYGMCEVGTIPEYRVFNKNNEYLGYIETIYEPDEEGYSITKYYITDDDGQTIDQCSLQGRSSTTTTKTEEMFAKYIVKEVVIANNQIFGGRIQKMASLIAGFTTMQFNKNFDSSLKAEQLEVARTPDNFEYYNLMASKAGNAWFDTRMYGVESPEEAYNSLMWRVRDAEKNSRSMFAQTYCSHKSLLNKTGPEQVAFCLAETGKDWDTIIDGYKYGFITKREEYQKVIQSNEMGFGDEGDTVTRTRTITWAESMTSFSEESVDLIVRKLK